MRDEWNLADGFDELLLSGQKEHAELIIKVGHITNSKNGRGVSEPCRVGQEVANRNILLRGFEYRAHVSLRRNHHKSELRKDILELGFQIQLSPFNQLENGGRNYRLRHRSDCVNRVFVDLPSRRDVDIARGFRKDSFAALRHHDHVVRDHASPIESLWNLVNPRNLQRLR